MSERQRRRPGELPPPGGPTDALAAEEQLLRDYAHTRDENAREELVRRFLPFARSLAMRYSGGVEPSDDLFQVASLGLVSALERYDPERGVPFAAFAGPTILGELRRHFRDRVWTLRVPRGLQESIRAVDGADRQAQPRARALADGRRDRRAARGRRGRRAGGVRGRRRAPDRLTRPADRRLGARRRGADGRADRRATIRASSWSRTGPRSTPAPRCSTRPSARSCACASPRT